MKKENSTLSEDKIELIKQLKVETNYSMMDCKRALYEGNWNIEKAKVWLRLYFEKKSHILFK